MITGLVLGGGGASGWLFHVGVVETLIEAGHEPSSLLVVGTSAGAAVGAAWKSGARPTDIRAMIDREPTEEERKAMRAEMEERDDEWQTRFRPLEPGLAVRAWRTGGIGPAVAGLLPAGRFPTRPFGEIGEGDGSWPSDLWITATAVDDGSAVVFGRDHTDVPLGDAVEASVAMPGILQPKEIAGRRYIDGGAVSPTHADQVLWADVESAIVSSPMSVRTTALGRFARRRLTTELEALDDARVPYLLVQPSQHLRSVFSAYPRKDRSVGEVLVEEGRAAMAAALA